MQRGRDRKSWGGGAPPRVDRDAQVEAIEGLRAGLAVLAKRPHDVVQVAFAPALRREVLAASRALPGASVRVLEVPDAELDRIAGSRAHEGLIVTARPRAWTTPKELCDALVSLGATAIAFDRVRNPLNVGAILRTAAFFGVHAAIVGAPAPHPGLPPAAVRVAEGGVEHLVLCRTTDLADSLGRLRARGIAVIGADAHASRSALGFPFRRPSVLVVGHEREGLGDRVRAACDSLVAIRGQGSIESLNVGVAAGLLIAELTRDRS